MTPDKLTRSAEWHWKSYAYGSSVSTGSGAGEGGIIPPIGLPTKIQNKEITAILAFLRISFALE